MLPIVSGALLLPKINTQLLCPHAPVFDVATQPVCPELTVPAKQGADQAAAHVFLLGQRAPIPAHGDTEWSRHLVRA